jgi:hypothetical protein
MGLGVAGPGVPVSPSAFEGAKLGDASPDWLGVGLGCAGGGFLDAFSAAIAASARWI